MKKGKLLLLFILGTLSCVAQQLKRTVDERFELTSIVFRLAGIDEYQSNDLEAYTADIDTYFAGYREHPIMSFTQNLREKYKIGYDAVPAFTCLLQLENGEISLNQQIDVSLFLESEPRWNLENVTQYAKLLNDFYKVSNFRKFFNSHLVLYTQAEVAFNEILQRVDTSWYESFYGKPFGVPTIYISMTNGRNNYAMPFNYAIIVSCANLDSEGVPTFPSSTVNTLVHEIAHNYSNPLIERYESLFIEAANKMYPYLEESLKRAATERLMFY